MSTTPSRVAAGVPTGGQFAASAKGESGVTLDAAIRPTEPSGPTRLRHPMRVREDQAFLDAMEAAEAEVRVRDLNRGDWAREFGEEWGVVKSVGLHTLRTDTWSDSDTDEGDHVVATVPKDVGDALLAEHGALPTRAVNAYVKRKADGLAVADEFESGNLTERADIGHNRLRKAAVDLWYSGKEAGIAAEPETDGVPSSGSVPEMQRLEQAYFDFDAAKDSDEVTFAQFDDASARLVSAMRGAINACDRQYSPNLRMLPLSQARLDAADFTAGDLAELADGETMEFHGAKTAHVSVTVERKPITRDGQPVPGIGKGSYQVRNHDHPNNMVTTIPFNNAIGNEGDAAKSAALAVHRLLGFDDD